MFYLIDFCYFVNIATAVFLVWFPNNAQLEALVYALADGPIAGALVAWQCPWVFGSGEHTVRWVGWGGVPHNSPKKHRGRQLAQRACCACNSIDAGGSGREAIVGTDVS